MSKVVIPSICVYPIVERARDARDRAYPIERASEATRAAPYPISERERSDARSSVPGSERSESLFYSDGLGEIARLIDVTPATYRDVIREQLQRDDDRDGCELRGHRRN